MNIYFADEDLKLNCNDFVRAKKLWGKQKAKKLVRHLQQVLAATSFADLRQMKHLHLEKLKKRKGKRHEQWSIVVEGALRVIFYPYGDELTWRDASGDYIWKNMRAIEIIEVVDYHDE